MIFLIDRGIAIFSSFANAAMVCRHRKFRAGALLRMQVRQVWLPLLRHSKKAVQAMVTGGGQWTVSSRTLKGGRQLVIRTHHTVIRRHSV